jgi:hypothetical protein
MNGFTVWAKVFHAISYLKGWTAIPYFDGRSPIGKVPFCACGVEVDARWVEWKATWADGAKELVLEADGQGGPLLRYREGVKVRLVPAAIPSLDYAGERGKSIDFVVEGLEIMARLGWKDGKRYIELWHGAFQIISALERK